MEYFAADLPRLDVINCKNKGKDIPLKNFPYLIYCISNFCHLKLFDLNMQLFKHRTKFKFMLFLQADKTNSMFVFSRCGKHNGILDSPPIIILHQGYNVNFEETPLSALYETLLQNNDALSL